MRYRLLLDENIERAVATRLKDLDHDVERVQLVPELGSRADDTSVSAYVRKTDRILLTYDDDFVVNNSDLPVMYVPDESLAAEDVAAIVRTIAEYYPQNELDGVVYASLDWI